MWLHSHVYQLHELPFASPTEPSGYTPSITPLDVTQLYAIPLYIHFAFLFTFAIQNMDEIVMELTMTLISQRISITIYVYRISTTTTTYSYNLYVVFVYHPIINNNGKKYYLLYRIH